jgi:hypothetical protein
VVKGSWRLIFWPPWAAMGLNQRVTIAVGLFDLFTYAIPGGMYLAFLGYLTVRLHWIAPGAFTSTPAVLLVIAAILLSYVLGYLADPIGKFTNRVVPQRRRGSAVEEFLTRVPAARDRDYIHADKHLLLWAAHLHNRDTALEVTRLRATGLMLRNAAPPLLFGLVAAIVELVTGAKPAPAIATALVLAAGFVILTSQGRKLRYWAALATLEICFWIPDIDAKTSPPLRTEQ